jgi:hypothetical protein
MPLPDDVGELSQNGGSGSFEVAPSGLEVVRVLSSKCTPTATDLERNGGRASREMTKVCGSKLW